MNSTPLGKMGFGLVGVALVLAACSTSVAPPTQAPTTDVQATAASTSAPALVTSIIETPLVLPVSQTPSLPEAGTPTVAVGAATSGGPIIITVLPAGTPNPQATAATPVPPTPIPTLAGGLGPTTIKYHVLAAFPGFFYCDPDLYPLGRDENQQAQLHFPELQADAEQFNAILAQNSLAGVTSFTADQKLLVYRDHKKLAAIRFELQGTQYQFQLQDKDSNGKGLLITGLVNGNGDITAQQSQPAVLTCPI